MSALFVFPVMGTVVSLTTPDAIPVGVQQEVAGAFHRYDARFSLWRLGSEGDRVARRDLPLRDASPEFHDVYDQATRWRFLTGNAFRPRRPDGAIDLSGLVKALALDEAGKALTDAGCEAWCLNAGGDILVSGDAPDGRPWHAGVVDPRDRQVLLSGLDLGEGTRALATSGTAERGEHVWRAGADHRFCQVSVSAPDIVTADVWATAILAGGVTTLQHAAAQGGVDVLACGVNGEFWSTPAFRTAPPAA